MKYSAFPLPSARWPRNAGGVTGRDGYIIAQALYWLIREQQKLPVEQFEWSNIEDAKLILLTWLDPAGQFFAETDRIAGRTPANLELENDRNVVTLR